MIKEPETQEQVDEAIADYTNLLSNSGWKRFVAQVDANIEELQRQLEVGIENEKYNDLKRIRDKLKLLREMRNTPEKMISRLRSPETSVANPDPFETVLDLQKTQTVDKAKK